MKNSTVLTCGSVSNFTVHQQNIIVIIDQYWQVLCMFLFRLIWYLYLPPGFFTDLRPFNVNVKYIKVGIYARYFRNRIQILYCMTKIRVRGSKAFIQTL